MESLDYRYHDIFLNKHTAMYSEDGSRTRIVLCHAPPSSDEVESACARNSGNALERKKDRKVARMMAHILDETDTAEQSSSSEDEGGASDDDMSGQDGQNRQDGGIPMDRWNWLTTTDHFCGTMCFRWVKPEVDGPDLPAPQPKVVKMADLMAGRE
jgi:hypothetical protein